MLEHKSEVYGLWKISNMRANASSTFVSWKIFFEFIEGSVEFQENFKKFLEKYFPLFCLFCDVKRETRNSKNI